MVSDFDEGSQAAVLGPDEGEVLGDPAGAVDRFMIGTERTDGRFSLVEHRLAPLTLAAPLHLHTREDEWSYVLEGEIGAVSNGVEVVVPAGSLLYKPRGEWHTFWNPGSSPARVLEMISPGGLEELFRLLGNNPESMDPDRLAELARQYGAEVDFERTFPIVTAHALRF